jgi:hypothetical protein
LHQQQREILGKRLSVSLRNKTEIPHTSMKFILGGHAKKGGTLSRKGNTELQFSLLTRRGFFFFLLVLGN